MKNLMSLVASISRIAARIQQPVILSNKYWVTSQDYFVKDPVRVTLWYKPITPEYFPFFTYFIIDLLLSHAMRFLPFLSITARKRGWCGPYITIIDPLCTGNVSLFVNPQYCTYSREVAPFHDKDQLSFTISFLNSLYPSCTRVVNKIIKVRRKQSKGSDVAGYEVHR